MEKCSSCGQFIADTEHTCPNCGRTRKTPLTESQTIEALKPSALAGWLMLIAIVNFIAAALAVLLFAGNADENRLGWILLPLALSGGFWALALMKIIECLHESTWHSKKATEQREFLVSQARGECKSSAVVGG